MPDAKQIEKALFEAARNLKDAEARQALLDRACHDDPVLRARIERLIAVQETADEFFGISPMSASRTSTGGDHTHTGGTTLFVNMSLSAQSTERPAPESPNATIGRYRLLQRLGEGGCGVVYLAEQKEPVRRRVALKIIRLGMDTENVIARFEMERQALALMDHPNIAHVLDAGATESGRPYFVMELVRGVKITDYCNQNQLDTRRRLQLFIQICHAIQHAHQKGVIHRDIKPSNILVTLHDGEPVPKVIDFGIAKATEGRLTDNTIFTAVGQFIGTPAYMSPEQASLNGLDADTRSDIYSLGVLLYELLTNRTPFDSKALVQAGLDEMRRTLLEKEPQRPSTMVTTLQADELTKTALQRRTEPPKLISTLQGDLDWIVMKALEKDRQRRYETANGLAMDVERFLNNEPVVARPPSQLYRLQKLIDRNKITFAATGAVAAALILGFGTSTWLFIQERASRRAAERGRANEITLREQAEARERITQAAVLVGADKYPEAARLVEGATLPDSMLEGEAVFRSLGDWSASQGQWTRAAIHFNKLLQADQVETGDLSTLDYSRCAAVLVEGGDRQGYEAYRENALKRFAGTTDPLLAERTIKNCLLLPADELLLRRLAPLASLAAKSIPADESVNDSNNWMSPWRCLSLALMDYRLGDYEASTKWCQRGLSYVSNSNSRASAIRAILAMDFYRTRQFESAREQLAQCRDLLDDEFQGHVEIGNTPQGYWFDWIHARILFREASGLINDFSPEQAY